MGERRARRRVLIVEDDAGIQATLCGLLEDEGYDCEVRGDGQSALEAVRAAMPDLVVLDLILPGMDGWQFLEAYRRLPAPRAPVLVTSSQPPPPGEDLGYVARPFDMDQLLAEAHRLLGEGSLTP